MLVAGLIIFAVAAVLAIFAAIFVFGSVYASWRRQDRELRRMQDDLATRPMQPREAPRG